MTSSDNSPSQKLASLRKRLAGLKLDGFYLTRADRFQGEEVREADELLAYLTGFTGSAGVGVILANTAALFTDGRYRIQIAKQTQASLYEVYDSADKSLSEWMASQAASGLQRLGYDSWTVTQEGLKRLPKKLGEAEIEWVALSQNPVAEIWSERPGYPKRKPWFLTEEIAGLTAKKKQAAAAAELREKNLDYSLITAPDCVNWLANLRGQDLMHTPFQLCFGLLDKVGHLRFIGGGEALRKDGYDVLEWSDLADFFSPLKGRKIGCDPASLPVAMRQLLTKAGCDLVERPEPVLAIKAIKHATEIEGFKQAHLLDGLALCQFWYWLENIPLDGRMHEADLAQELTAIRAKEPAYLCNSFATISGFRANGAIVHYRAVKGMDSPIEGSGILLVDSGAHYQMGTTDITRTFFLGSPEDRPSAEAVMHSSYVLAGHIELARARFPMGATGAQLDVICRAPLWAEGLDFGHGTGHGVGHILSVHEGPVSISKRCLLAIEAGMILSNEPGFYAEGKYGIRHENLVLATQKPGNFLGFETLSCFPFDKRLIDLNILTSGQKDWLNSYHHWVYNHLSPHLDKDMRGWLAEKCAPL